MNPNQAANDITSVQLMATDTFTKMIDFVKNKQIILPFDFSNVDEDPVQLAQFLAQQVVERNGISLAAPQVGLPVRVVALKSNPIIVAFNPVIVEASEDLEILEEVSLSNPGIILKIKRPNAVKVRFTEANQNVRTEFYMGLTARYFQQAIDYLDGIPFTKRANSYHLEQAKKKVINVNS